jgi:amidase
VAKALDAPMPPLRIGLCIDGPAGFPVDGVRRQAVIDAGSTLAAAGHLVVPIGAAQLDRFTQQAALVFDRVVSVNLARNLGGLGDTELALVEPLTRAVLARGRAMSGVALQEAEAAGVGVAHGMWRLFADVDVLLTPMLAFAPLPIGSFPSDHGDVEGHWRRMTAFAPYAVLANVAGTPALTVPHGVDRQGLPLPVQLIGPMGHDGRLLGLAQQLESVRPWSIPASFVA